MWLRRENRTVMGYSFVDLSGSSKVSKDGNFDVGVDVKLNLSIIWVL